jgi:hypothetical protein
MELGSTDKVSKIVERLDICQRCSLRPFSLDNFNRRLLSKADLVSGLLNRKSASPRVDHYFGDAVFFVAPNFIHFGSFVKRNAVRNDVARIDLALFHTLQ